MKLMVIPVGRSLVFFGSQAQNISYPADHRRKIFRTLPITGKKYFALYPRWLGEGNFLVQILCGGSVIGHTTDPAPAPIASPLEGRALHSQECFLPSRGGFNLRCTRER